MNEETRVAVNSISKGEKIVILYQFSVTVGRMLCSWIRFSFIFKQAEAVERWETGLCRAMYGYVWLCMAIYGYVGLCRAM